LKFNKICVLGLGYIGLPTASTFAAHGVKVLGVDVNPNIVDTLRRGDIHIHEPGLRETYKTALASGNLTVSTKPEEADASSLPYLRLSTMINSVNTRPEI